MRYFLSLLVVAIGLSTLAAQHTNYNYGPISVTCYFDSEDKYIEDNLVIEERFNGVVVSSQRDAPAKMYFPVVMQTNNNVVMLRGSRGRSARFPLSKVPDYDTAQQLFDSLQVCLFNSVVGQQGETLLTLETLPSFWEYDGQISDTTGIKRDGSVSLAGVPDSNSVLTINQKVQGQLTGSSSGGLPGSPGWGASNSGSSYIFSSEEDEPTEPTRVKVVIDQLGDNTSLLCYAETVGFSTLSVEINGVIYADGLVDEGEGGFQEQIPVSAGDSIVFILGPTAPGAGEYFAEGGFSFSPPAIKKPIAITATGDLSLLLPLREGGAPTTLPYGLTKGVHILADYQSVIFSDRNFGGNDPLDIGVVPKFSFVRIRGTPDWAAMSGSIFLPTSSGINTNSANIFASLILGDFEFGTTSPFPGVNRSVLVGSGFFNTNSIFNLQVGSLQRMDGSSTISVGDRNEGFCDECLIVGQENEVGTYSPTNLLKYTTVLGRKLFVTEGDGGLYVGSWNVIEPDDDIRDNDPMFVVATGSFAEGRRNVFRVQYDGRVDMPAYADGGLVVDSGILVSKTWQGETFTATASQSSHTATGGALPTNEWEFSVVVDGLEKTNGVDYTYVSGTGVITFTPALTGGELVKLRFYN